MRQPIFLYRMPSQILLATHINAPVERVFDIARNIDVHVESTSHTGEQAIAGRTSGLIELGETVTWRAKHFGVWQNLTSKITEMEYPNHFTDIMIEGAFKSFTHEHYFYPILNQTMMRDIFTFQSPGGILGDVANYLFLSNYMTRLLLKRNEVIKQIAEGIQGNRF
jgi:ligand-binding SRPBCC domain-containing protein